MTKKVMKRALGAATELSSSKRALRANRQDAEPFVFVEPTDVQDAMNRLDILRTSSPTIDDRIISLNARIDRDRQDIEAIEERVVLGRKKTNAGHEIRSLRLWLASHGAGDQATRQGKLLPVLKTCYRILDRINRGVDVPSEEIEAALDAIEYHVPGSVLDEP